jgi:hypothetical protein
MGEVLVLLGRCFGGTRTPDFSDIERQHREAWLGRVVSHIRAAEAPVSWPQSLHIFVHTENAQIAS